MGDAQIVVPLPVRRDSSFFSHLALLPADKRRRAAGTDVSAGSSGTMKGLGLNVMLYSGAYGSLGFPPLSPSSPSPTMSTIFPPDFRRKSNVLDFSFTVFFNSDSAL